MSFTGISFAHFGRIRFFGKGFSIPFSAEKGVMEDSISFPHTGTPAHPHVLSVSSGKGGVGKTNTVINLAVEIQRRGHKVLIFDADLGLSNIPVLLGLLPEFDLSHLLFGEKRMRDILFPGPEGVMILPACTGIHELAALTEEQKLKMICETENLEEDFDYVVVDTGPGISPNVIFFNIASQDNIILIYPEPAAVADAYALMKILALQYNRKRFTILLNGIRKKEEETQILEKITLACNRFLKVSVTYLGAIPYDDHIRKSIRMQTPLVQAYPEAPSSQCFNRVAERFLSMPSQDCHFGSLRFFWKKLLDSGDASFFDPAPDLPPSPGLGSFPGSEIR